MNFTMSERALQLHEQLKQFMEVFVYPVEDELHPPRGDNRWETPPLLEELKQKAKERGLWNLFLSPSFSSDGLSNVDYAPICETMGRVFAAPEIFNCSAPDTGNTEVLLHYGSDQQKERWLQLLLDGKIRSAFAMTEPDVASSDATNIRTSIERQGDHYIINGRIGRRGREKSIWWWAGFNWTRETNSTSPWPRR